MAKKKRRVASDEPKVNKTKLITEELAKDPDAAPKEVAARVGHGVTPRYVSTVKTNLRAAAKKTVKKKPGRPKGSKQAAAKPASAATHLDAAIAFVKAAGGLEAAKQQIEVIEQIKQL